jgi:hypothetical protein
LLLLPFFFFLSRWLFSVLSHLISSIKVVSISVN